MTKRFPNKTQQKENKRKLGDRIVAENQCHGGSAATPKS